MCTTKWFSYVVIQSPSRVWLCAPLDCSIPDVPVPHHLLEFAQVHIHCISDAIQPSHPLTPSSPSALNLAQHQGLFQWVACLHQTTDQNYCHHYPFLYLPPVYLPRWVINRPEKHFSDILIMSTLAKKKKRMSLLESTTLQWYYRPMATFPKTQS